MGRKNLRQTMQKKKKRKELRLETNFIYCTSYFIREVFKLCYLNQSKSEQKRAFSDLQLDLKLKSETRGAEFKKCHKRVKI